MIYIYTYINYLSTYISIHLSALGKMNKSSGVLLLRLLPPHPCPLLSLGGRGLGVGSPGLRECRVLVSTSTASSQEPMGNPWETHGKPMGNAWGRVESSVLYHTCSTSGSDQDVSSWSRKSGSWWWPTMTTKNHLELARSVRASQTV